MNPMLSAATFLTNFSPAVPGLRVLSGAPAGPEGGPLGDEKPADAAAEFERGRLEGMKSARLALEEEISAERQAAQSQLAEARQAFVRNEAERLEAGLRCGLEQIEERISSTLARLLLPVIEVQVRQHAIAEMRVVITDLLKEGAAVSVRGPADLVDALRQSAEFSRTCTFETAPDEAELHVASADTVVETRLSTWIEELRKAIA